MTSMAKSRDIVVGIDASNITGGGGLTHLVEMLGAFRFCREGVGRVIVWGSESTLAALPRRPWLEFRSPVELSWGLLFRIYWQAFQLARDARRFGCDVLLAPGGSYIGNFRPFATMSRNMLPFDRNETSRYSVGFIRVRFALLRWIQARSFRRADGLIFLTDFARSAVLELIGPPKGRVVTIPHGVSNSFAHSHRIHRGIEQCASENPFRLVYVSHISHYKHQWHVIEAVARLRSQTGWPVVIDFIGGAPIGECFDRFCEARIKYDSASEWCHYQGVKGRQELGDILRAADLAVFASSCENMPNTLLEKMSAGLPVACSNRGPMPECLGGAGRLFDPESPADISNAIEELIADVELRKLLSTRAVSRAREFTWERCARDTFRFIFDLTR